MMRLRAHAIVRRFIVEIIDIPNDQRLYAKGVCGYVEAA